MIVLFFFSSAVTHSCSEDIRVSVARWRVLVHVACACVRVLLEGRKIWSFSPLKKYGLRNTFLAQEVCTPFSCFPCILGGLTLYWGRGAGNGPATKPLRVIPFLYLCAIMAASVSHLLGSVSFLPQ